MPVQDNTHSAPDVSVIIVSWNVRDLLLNCIRALRSSPVRGSLSLEILVVDNASTDGTAAVLRDAGDVSAILCERNLGYGRANNLGFQHARGRFLLVLNPDTEPRPGSLEALVNFAEARPRAGIVAPRLLNPDETVQTAAFRFPTLVMSALDLFPLPSIVPGRIRAGMSASRINGRYPGEASAEEPFQIDHPLGACMLLRRDAYRQVGGFDPRLFMYSEEVDLAMRYRRAGWECWQVPEARVFHLGGQSTKQVPDRMFIELWRSRLHVYARHYSLTSRAALSALLALSQSKDAAVAWLGERAGLVPPAEARRRRRRARAVLRLLRRI